MLVIVGIISFFMTDRQFIIVGIFHPYEALAATGYILLGILLLILGFIRRSNSGK